MSLEFSPTDGNPEVINAARSIEAEIRTAGSIWRYLEDIEEEFNETSEGQIELFEMNRASTFITQQTEINPASALAFKSGELLAQVLLKRSGADKKLTDALVLSFIEVVEEASEEFDTTEEVVEQIQQSLTSGLPVNQTNNAYEKFVSNNAQLFDPISQQNRTYFSMGYRLIIQEYLLRKENADIMNHEFEVFDAGDSPARFNEIRMLLNTALFKINKAYGPIDTSDPEQLRQVKAEYSALLNIHNQEKQYINGGDFIDVSGFYFARKTDSSGTHDIASSRDLTIQGIFEDLTIISAPSNGQLKSYAQDAMADEHVVSDLAIVPAIKLRVPSFINTENPQLTESIYEPNATVEIPLIYSFVNFQRLYSIQPSDAKKMME